MGCERGRSTHTLRWLLTSYAVQHGLPWDIPVELPDTGGVTVTVIKANHCVLFPSTFLQSKQLTTFISRRPRIVAVPVRRPPNSERGRFGRFQEPVCRWQAGLAIPALR
jgi:hypothetical protein